MSMTNIYLHAFFFFFNDTATTEIYTLSLHDALPISESSKSSASSKEANPPITRNGRVRLFRSEEHTSELQSLRHLVCRLLLEKKKNNIIFTMLMEIESYTNCIYPAIITTYQDEDVCR